MAVARSRPLSAFWASSRSTASVRAWARRVSATWISVSVSRSRARSSEMIMDFWEAIGGPSVDMGVRLMDVRPPCSMRPAAG